MRAKLFDERVGDDALIQTTDDEKSVYRYQFAEHQKSI